MVAIRYIQDAFGWPEAPMDSLAPLDGLLALDAVAVIAEKSAEIFGAAQAGNVEPILDREFPPIARRMNIRLHPDQVGFATGHPSGEAVVSGWVDIPFTSSTALMPLVSDALPPSLFNTGEFLGPVPTIELTVHTHARPSPGPVAARFRTDHAGPRYVEEDGWIIDSPGKLITVSRQIPVLPL